MQFGEVAANVAAASDSANLTFDSTMALGASARTLTLGNAGTVTFGGVISNTATNGLTFAATTGGSGRFELTNTTNTFTGPISITGGEVRFAANGSLGNAANTVTVDGGRLGIVNAAGTVDLSSRSIYLGSTAGTSISAPGALTTILKYDGVLQDKTGSNGILVKQGQGILSLGGVSTYTGDTSINNGNIQLTTGNNRLPTGTVVNIGQSASANLGTLDLNGLNQQIAGLNSTSGTNATTGKNTVTSAAVATLTIGGAGSYSYGDGTNANSGVITGAISLVKQGNGIQTLGDANTYTGNTNVAAGTLVINGNQSAATGYVTLANGATLMGTGTVGGATTINGTHAPTAQASGSSQTFSSTLNYAPNSTFEWNLNAAPDDPGANASNLGTYGQVAAAGTVSGTSAFKVVLGANSFTDAFWDTNKSWNNIFTGAGVTTGTLHSLFATFDTTTGVDSTGHVAGQGYFTFTPTGNTLTWTAAVPEPTTGALVGLLAGAGLLRRRRAGV
jgi:autotransporter-associated beta strand protein